MHYIIENQRLKYKKNIKDKSDYKTIPYIHEVYEKIDKLHRELNHINFHDFKNKLLKTDFFMEGLDIIIKEYYKSCPECYSKYYANKIIKHLELF